VHLAGIGELRARVLVAQGEQHVHTIHVDPGAAIFLLIIRS
jgi:hypothetical protein